VEGLEITVLLGISVLVGAILAPRLRIAAPLLLLIFGLALGFVPQLREIELPPETMLLLFLPVMLFWESLTTSLRSIKRDFRGIVLMSTLLVVASAFAVAWVANLFGVPWAAALILGAAVAPPDATAVAALGRTLPRRNFMLLKAESLTNDGTALVIYAIAVGIALGGTYTPLSISGMVLLSYVGGIAAGAVVAGAAYLVMRRLSDPIALNVALLLAPFTAFLLAEVLHASGVLAVVVAGLIVAFVSPRISTAASRRQTEAAWPLGSFVLNGALFVLIGLQVQAVVQEIEAADFGRLLAIVVAVWVALLVVRFLFQVTSAHLIRALDRRPSQRERRMSHRARVVSTFAGFRGAVSLAIALSVPTVLANGEPLPGREAIVFVTAGVIILTLLVQGPLLPAVVRWARLPEDTTAGDELHLAERAITTAALNALSDLATEHGVSEEVRDHLKHDYQESLELANARRMAAEQRAAADQGTDFTPPPERMEPAASAGAGAGAGADTMVVAEDIEVIVDMTTPLTRDEEYRRLRLAVLDRKREVLIRLRREALVDDSIVRQVQTRLDIEELRLSGVEAVE
jgi:CPA1 family monovalent cation:H+ antiporter